MSASETTVNDLSLDEELICAVCRDIFVEPVTLPCGHNYCEECVEQLKRSLRRMADDDGEGIMTQYYSCPLCLTPCDSRIGLKKNVVLHNIIEKYQRKRSAVDCSVCKGDQKMAADKFCLNCNESFCIVHIMPHQENSSLRRHVLIHPTSNTSRLCKEHGKELELYCESDDTALCVYCMIPSESKHLSGHSVVKLSEALTKLKEDCNSKLSSVKNNLSEVQDELAKLEEASSLTKAKVECQQEEYSAILSRIKLFLDLEEKAWQKRFSVDLVQEKQNVMHRAEKLSRLRRRLENAQEALLSSLSVNEPLVLLQTSKNTEWADLYDREAFVHQIQGAREWRGLKPVASDRISPLLKTVCSMFPGDDIRLNSSSACPGLQLNSARNELWVAEVAGNESDPANSGAMLYVLGDVAFDSGIHHWEVAVGSVSGWTVGISYSYALGSGLGAAKHSWGLGYSRSRRQFYAQHDKLLVYFSDSPVSIPDRVGIFLDVNSGILSFYEASKLAHLHTFYCSLQAPVYPAFGLSSECCRGRAQHMTVLNPFPSTHVE